MTDRKIRYAFDKVLKKGKVRKCLLASQECSGSAIDSHSIQNSTILEGLSEDGHVFTLRQDADAPGIKLKYTGRNVASTFPGFCSYHDTKLFCEIDFNRENVPHAFTQKQMVLFFLRAISIEGWKKQSIVNSFEGLAAALENNYFNKISKILGIPEDLIREAIVNPEVIVWSTLGHIQGLEDMEKIVGSLLWQIDKGKLHGTVSWHWTMNLCSNVAVASGISPLWDIEGNELYGESSPGLDEKMCHMGLNVFEANRKTNILISYLKKDH